MNAIPASTIADSPSAVVNAVRPFYWSLRRELWEHRSLYFVPLAIAVLMFVSFVLNAVHLTEGMRQLASLEPEKQRAAIMAVFAITAAAIICATLVANWFYCLDALHSERRDRSVLFWKSLPLSDVTTVTSKLFMAIAIVPAIALAFVIATQLLLLLLSTIILLLGDSDAGLLWTHVQYLEFTVVMIGAVLALSLWLAPIYSYLLLISAWAKRATFLWAALTLFAIAIAEKLVLGTSHFIALIKYRLGGWIPSLFSHSAAGDFAVQGESANAYADFGASFPAHPLQLLNPINFLTDPHLWGGLIVAAGFVAAAVWLRRYREPL
jgi:ABC-2 type transport system permease protein